MLGVVGQVAPLAHVPEVLELVVLWRMVEMRHGEDDDRAGHRVFEAVDCAAVRIEPGRAFAAIAGTLADELDDLAPVVRIAVAVFRFDRHGVATAVDTLYGPIDHLRTDFPQTAGYPTDGVLAIGLRAAW